MPVVTEARAERAGRLRLVVVGKHWKATLAEAGRGVTGGGVAGGVLRDFRAETMIRAEFVPG